MIVPQFADIITQKMKEVPVGVATAMAAQLWSRYESDVVAFARECCKLKVEESGKSARWAPFDLWPAQEEAMRLMDTSRRSVVLKARQLGLTWLSLAIILHRLVFREGVTCLIISLREVEAKETLKKLRGMWDRLPHWLKAPQPHLQDDATCFQLSNGSMCRALPSNRGDSYTVSFALVDEAAMIPRLKTLLGSMEPTAGDTGQICLVSRANKSDPIGTFATMARIALVDRKGDWAGCFLPWSARPGRTQEWYRERCDSAMERFQCLDSVHEQYPATIEEALAPSTSTVRIPSSHVSGITSIELGREFPGQPGVRIYRDPEPHLRYVIGADAADGLPDGDESAFSVLCVETGEEVCAGAGQWDSGYTLPQVLAVVARYYACNTTDFSDRCSVLCERNSIGQATINKLRELAIHQLYGPDNKIGYQKTASTKTGLWTDVATIVYEHYTDANAGVDVAPLIRSREVASQVGLIQRDTCKAPPGLHDDRADAWALAQWARSKMPKTTSFGALGRRR